MDIHILWFWVDQLPVFLVSSVVALLEHWCSPRYTKRATQYRAVTTAYETSFHLPWAAIGIAVLSVFLVVFATMMYSMSKVKKDNPIDALKNENL